MPIEGLMPQMGQSVAEGTGLTWLKREGGGVGQDEPLPPDQHRQGGRRDPLPRGGSPGAAAGAGRPDGSGGDRSRAPPDGGGGRGGGAARPPPGGGPGRRARP